VVEQVDEEALTKLEDEVVTKWYDYTVNGTLIYRQPIVISNARK